MDPNKDYYKVLGVSKNDSESDIKKTYRELAKKYHPDKHKGDEKVADRFKEISEAYDTIGDAKKRKEYDEMRSNPFANYNGRANRSRQSETSFDDLFGSFFGGGQQRQTRQKAPADISLNISIPLHLGIKGGDYLYKTPLGKTIKLRIPKNCEEGHQLRIKGEGPNGETLILVVKFTCPPDISLQKNDVIQKIHVSVWDIILGEKKEISLYDGKQVSVTIKPGSSSHNKLKLKGLGLTNKLGQGDCYLELIVDSPKELTEEQKTLLQNIKYNTRI